MKRMRKVISLILTLSILVTALPLSASAQSQAFRDVKPGSWYEKAVQYVNSQGLMTGTGSGFFSPNRFTTRGQMVTILYKMAGSPYVSASSPFYDVRPKDYFYKAVLWASNANIVSGKGNGRFCPNDTLKRQEAVAILYRYSKRQGYSTRQRCQLTFSDSNQVKSYFQDAVKWACASQLLTGTSSRALAPNSATTRAQMAVMLTKYCKTMRNSTFDDAARRWDSYLSSSSFLGQLGLRSDAPSLQYTMGDLNGDGVPELVIQEPAYGSSYEWSNNWIAVLQGGSARLAGGSFVSIRGDKEWKNKMYGYGTIYYLPKENAFHVPSNFRSSANVSAIAFYKLSGTTMTFSSELGHDVSNKNSEYFLITPSGTKPMSHAAGQITRTVPSHLSGQR